MDKIRVAILTGVTRLSGAPTLVAQGQGYFADQDLDVEFVGSHGDHAMEMVCTDEIDVAAMRPSLYFYRDWDQARPAALMADGGRLLPGKGGGAIVARPALIADGKLHDYQDLRGLRIGLSPDKGDHDWLTIATALRKGSLDWDAVEVVECDYGDGRHEALAKGAIDVTTVSNAKSVTQGQATGAFLPWKYENDVEAGRQAAAIIFSHSMRSDSERANRFMLGYLQGARDYYRAFTDGESQASVFAALSGVSGLSADVVAKDIIPLAIDPNGYLNVASLREDLDWMHEAGVIPEAVTPDRVVDYSPLETALAQLGRYAAN